MIDVTKPIVFLDIDGVLNSANFFRKENSYDRVDPRSQLDPEAISYLNEIADWNFILSSSWRNHYSIEAMNEMLCELGFRGKIVAYTPKFNWSGALRGNEIYSWIRNNVTNASYFKKYIIFDDDSDMLLWQKDNFIHVDGHFGLSPNHVYKAKLALDAR